MTKFERNEEGKYECPECERNYEKYNSLYQHYRQKHGNSNGEETVNRAVKSIANKADKATKSMANKTKETVKTATKGIIGSDSENNIADDDDNQSSEIVNESSVSIAPKRIKRVRLNPVEPPVKKPQKATENETENAEETETETWIIPGILKGSSKKQKLSEEDVDKKWMLIKGVL